MSIPPRAFNATLTGSYVASGVLGRDCMNLTMSLQGNYPGEKSLLELAGMRLSVVGLLEYKMNNAKLIMMLNKFFI